MIGRIAQQRGALFVLYESTSDGRPELHRMWWRVVSLTGNPYSAERPSPGDVATYRGEGTWSTHHGETHRTTGSVCTGSGSAPASSTEIVPVPVPRVRAGIETRWHQGEWQKYTKAKGWVRA